MNSNRKSRSSYTRLNGVKSSRSTMVSKNRLVTLENLSEAQVKKVISVSAVSAIRQNKKSGVTTLAAQNGNIVQVNPNGSQVIVRKAPSSLYIAKGKYKLVK